MVPSIAESSNPDYHRDSSEAREGSRLYRDKPDAPRVEMRSGFPRSPPSALSEPESLP